MVRRRNSICEYAGMNSITFFSLIDMCTTPKKQDADMLDVPIKPRKEEQRILRGEGPPCRDSRQRERSMNKDRGGPNRERIPGGEPRVSEKE